MGAVFLPIHTAVGRAFDQTAVVRHRIIKPETTGEVSSHIRNPPKYGRRYSCAGRSDRSHRPVYRARAHPAAPAVHPPGYCGSPRYVTAGIPAACAHPAGQRPKPLEIPARPVLAHMIDDPRQKSIRSGIFFHLMQKSLVLAKRWRCADCKGEPGTSFCGIHPEHLWSLDTGNAPRQCRAHGKADPDNRDFQKCVIVVRIVVKKWTYAKMYHIFVTVKSCGA